jgi:hypothetical protein
MMFGLFCRKVKKEAGIFASPIDYAIKYQITAAK